MSEKDKAGYNAREESDIAAADAFNIVLETHDSGVNKTPSKVSNRSSLLRESKPLINKNKRRSTSPMILGESGEEVISLMAKSGDKKLKQAHL